MSFLNEVNGAIRALKLQKAQIERELATLMPGKVVKRTVNGKDHYELVRSVDGETVVESSQSVSAGELEWYANVEQTRDTLTQRLADLEEAIRALAVFRDPAPPPEPHDLPAQAPHKSPQKKAKSKSTKSRAPKVVTRSQPLVLLWGEFPREGCIQLAREWGWDLLDLELTDGSIPKGVEPAGIITDLLVTHPDVKPFADSGCHVVRYGKRPNPQDHEISAVLPDLAEVGRMAAMHFLERGFKSVAHAGWDSEAPDSLFYPAYMAFRQCAEAHGIAFHLHRLDGQDITLTSYEARTHGAEEWINELPKPVGILIINDRYTANICVMCRHAGIQVPEEVALLGIGNDPAICEVTSPTLSSVDAARVRRSRQAMRLMHDLIMGKPVPREPVVIPPVGVVERQSTDLLAVEDLAVAQALRFMWDNLEKNISVGDVAEAVGVARRSLERSFRGQLGRSVNGELLRKRLEHCCHLLKTTELPIADVAPLCGFSSAGYLNKVFRNAFDTTPRKWRVSSSGTS